MPASAYAPTLHIQYSLKPIQAVTLTQKPNSGLGELLGDLGHHIVVGVELYLQHSAGIASFYFNFRLYKSVEEHEQRFLYWHLMFRKLRASCVKVSVVL